MGGKIMRMTKKDITLESARTHGYNNDKKAFSRLVCESRVNLRELNKMWNLGQKQKECGIL
jgi:hypothetical protein